MMLTYPLSIAARPIYCASPDVCEEMNRYRACHTIRQWNFIQLQGRNHYICMKMDRTGDPHVKQSKLEKTNIAFLYLKCKIQFYLFLRL